MNSRVGQPLPLHTPRIMGLETEYMVVPGDIGMSTEKLCYNAAARLGTHIVGEYLGNGGPFIPRHRGSPRVRRA